MLLYFVNRLNARILLIYCFYVNTFILLYFLRFQEGGTAPLNLPLHTALDVTHIVLSGSPKDSSSICIV